MSVSLGEVRGARARVPGGAVPADSSPPVILPSARRRAVKRVHEDVGVLIECGLVARTADGKINVPYDIIRTDFE